MVEIVVCAHSGVLIDHTSERPRKYIGKHSKYELFLDKINSQLWVAAIYFTEVAGGKVKATIRQTYLVPT